MPKIQSLDPHVADLIAAGEVVERPASAAKELVENAIDAGATVITVECGGGGVRLLRVTDNGCGMASDDAEMAFLRHATSKIRTAEDLQAIYTLGFRGEALAALASVARVQLITRERGAALGLSLRLEAGQIVARDEAGCPEGTTIVVRDLFYNTPARQKFLKKDTTESAHVQFICQRAALSRPDISFQFIKDGKQIFLTPGDSLLRSCLFALFGRLFVEGLCPIDYTHQDIAVTGFVSRPEASQGTRQSQHVFVGGRPVYARIVTAALEEAFKNALQTGRHPVCVMCVNLPPAAYDVNVHPAKSEVKFARERDVFDAVYFAVKSALEALDRPVWRSETAQAPRAAFHGTARPQANGFSSMTAAQFRAHNVPEAAPPLPLSSPAADVSRVTANRFVSRDAELKGASPLPVREAVLAYNAPVSPEAVPSPALQTMPTLASVRGWRYIGEALGGFLLVELPDELVMIDKHAAHERILFNRLKASLHTPMAQVLMTPLVVSLPPADVVLLLEQVSLLAGMGFSVEEFGDGVIALREAPSDVDMEDLPVLLGEISTRLREGRRDPAPQMQDDLLHLVACKAAIKLGRMSQRQEAESLVALVMDDPEVRHCPHGRPVTLSLSRSNIERQFKR